MTYQEFCDTTVSLVRLALPENATADLSCILKNNDTRLHAITIHTEDVNISPTIYLEQFYERYNQGTDLKAIVDQILTIWQESEPKASVDVSFYSSYENVKERLAFKLINLSRNEELLKDVPHLPYLDLAIVFYCLVNESLQGSATILVRNAHLAQWNKTVEDLFQQAEKNTPRLLAAELHDMNELLRSFPDLPEPFPPSEEPDNSMFVLSNRLKLNGASCILYKDMLKTISLHFQSDFYILPSSIHEVILLPAETNDAYEPLTHMVREVNASQVASDEILSDHVYYYSRESQALCM